MTDAILSLLAALAAGVSASREMIGKPNMVPANGYVTVCYGAHVFELPHPIALRSLFPLLLGPRGNLSEIVVERDSARCHAYQALRIAFAWAAFWILCAAYGPVLMWVTAALFILSLRFDYWSNFVELLAASIVLCSSRLGVPWPAQTAAGLVLGLGRETLPVLALVPGGIPFAAGATVTQAAVRIFSRQNKHELTAKFAEAIDYGTCKLKSYVWVGLTENPWETLPRLGLYFGILALAAPAIPWAVLALAAMTLAGSRIDEPRILTQLIPWASMALIGYIS